ncbi:N-acetyltransferase 9 isoform X1 [Cricetulus griseus]|uniref:Alpha/beta-tubulin-N-acetyltransferase 9 n=1 Tax=Cricetulus griseus TaxID=10029 RepID=A0A9J7JY19_CRIGR|nr:N-acetyltransferase 9 isoform X1 [Cricetulus griseus]XP_027281538.1 N-acetyltransferase 9 isoform X1 [Cricetulus griseus]
MRLNQNTVLLGKKVALVPYTSEHVPRQNSSPHPLQRGSPVTQAGLQFLILLPPPPRYHEWMKSEELRHLTASELLTLEQEYEMQCSWCEDEDKCTFIVLDAEKWQAQPRPPEESCMVGDVNLFLTDLEDPTLGEIEVMIAEPSCRGQGLGTEASLLMMSYDSGGVTKLGLTKFEAKIGQENEPSIRMFQKLHFKQVAVSNVFQEVTLRLAVTEAERQWLLEQTSHVEEKPYRVELAEPVAATLCEQTWSHPLPRPDSCMGESCTVSSGCSRPS